MRIRIIWNYFLRVVTKTAFGGGIMPYCWKCGAELKEEDKFRQKCGASITEEARRRRKREIERAKWWE
jgi:hypothetical protein